MALIITIMAGGEGKRMRSSIPKVLHLFRGKPMLVRIIEVARAAFPSKIVVITGKFHKQIVQTVAQYIDSFGIVFVEQPEPMGTGHAIQCSLGQYSRDDRILILNGDMPLLTLSVIENFIQFVWHDEFAVMTTRLPNPQGYGRIVMQGDEFTGIVEEKDCTEEQRQISVVNAGIYFSRGYILCDYIPKITNNNGQKEYYLTDMVSILRGRSIAVGTFLLREKENICLRGVNTPEELQELEKE